MNVLEAGQPLDTWVSSKEFAPGQSNPRQLLVPAVLHQPTSILDLSGNVNMVRAESTIASKAIPASSPIFLEPGID